QPAAASPTCARPGSPCDLQFRAPLHVAESCRFSTSGLTKGWQLAWLSRMAALACCFVLAAYFLMSGGGLSAAPFDAAPFSPPLPEGNGIDWEDRREIHQVIIRFKGDPPAADHVKLEYWGSRWPAQHLPKQKDIGSGESGWMELGNWYRYGWHTADA